MHLRQKRLLAGSLRAEIEVQDGMFRSLYFLNWGLCQARTDGEILQSFSYPVVTALQIQKNSN
jgi:hypothetical protein